MILQTRPTPAHLTSVQAEQILATACENESHNAKRMRLGLEPVSQPMPILPGAQVSFILSGNVFFLVIFYGLFLILQENSL